MKKYFGPKSFYKDAILIALPVMLQQLIQNLVSLIDNFMVAGLGDIKMSGVNVAGQMFFVFMILIETICNSGGIFMTQHFGANNTKGMKQAMCFKIILGFIGASLFSLLCFVIPDKLMGIMLINNIDANIIISEGLAYMKLMGLICFPFLVSTIIASSLREIGDVKPPLYICIIATAVNAFFNYALIYGNFGFPKLEVIGAAIATIIARLVEMFLFIIYIFVNKQPFAIKISDLLVIDWNMFKEIFIKASMILFSELTWVISETVTTAIYNGRGGADVVSGMASSFTISNLFFVSFGGIMTSTSVLIGKTLGKGELEEAKKKNNWLSFASIVFGLMMCGVALLTIKLVPIVFGNLSLSAQNICEKMVFYMGLFMPLWVYQNYQFALSRAGGDTKMGFYVDLIFTYLMYYPIVVYLALKTNIDPATLYAIAKLVDVPKVIFAYFWLKKERWVKNLAQGY